MKYPDFSRIGLQDLKFFITIAELGSMTAAADRLYVSQPLLSKRLSMLEEAIGIPLFTRRRKRLFLTPEGEYLLHQTKDLLSQFERAVENAGDIANNHFNRLVLGLVDGNGVGHLDSAQLIERIKNNFPTLDVEVIVEFSYQRMNERFYEREIDVLIAEERCLYKTDQDIVIQPLGYAKPALLVSGRSPFRTRTRVEIEELRNVQFIFYKGAGNELYNNWACHLCEKHGFTPNIVKYFPNCLSAVHNIIGSDYVMITTMNSLFQHSPGLSLVELDEIPIPIARDIGPLGGRLKELFTALKLEEEGGFLSGGYPEGLQQSNVEISQKPMKQEKNIEI